MEKKQEEELKMEYKKVEGEVRSLSGVLEQFSGKLFSFFKRVSLTQEQKRIEDLRKQIQKS